MLTELYGKLIREQRARKGLRQEELAVRAGVSRAVLSQLEQGKRRVVQSNTVERLLHALDVDPRALVGTDREDPRRVARLEHEGKLDRQRVRHLRVAVELAAGGPQAAAMMAEARKRVELWHDKKVCSPFYIKRWSRLLALPPRKLAREMAALGEWEDALFQNSPWSRAWS